MSGSSHVPQPSESYFFSGFTWESVVIGYSCGLVVGTVVWSLMFKYRKPSWFVMDSCLTKEEGQRRELIDDGLNGRLGEPTCLFYIFGTVMWSLMFKYRKPKWFVEFFDGLMLHKRRRPKKRAQRRRT
ncbi:hypothetical protein H5410_059259 [Solanum commersonii]|uniref:Transmembrane protein n=1 Tax=Solanum commersonii TaxID=4109 RepID=A0A9J5W1X6_SOLCO|nr:hypothetical protein H5410_059259 [Solanum commersonii]